MTALAAVLIVTGFPVIFTSGCLFSVSEASAATLYLVQQQNDPSPDSRINNTSGQMTMAGSSTEKDTTALSDVPGLTVEFAGEIGYRSDDLKWSIAGDTSGNNPNILSELTWENLGIVQLALKNKTIYRGVYFRGYFQYGWIVSGKNQDSDYEEDNRNDEFSRSNNSADNGSTRDLSAGIGYQFNFVNDSFGLTPLVGYSQHKQYLKMTDGNQTVTYPGGPPLGPFGGLDSTYDTDWKGPWLGLDAVFRSHTMAGKEAAVIDKFELGVGFEYHWTDYNAEADWNLRTDFAHPTSFEHYADGRGFVISAAWNIFFRNNWALTVNGSYQGWETDPGTDRTFFADGTTSETRLNIVEWDTYAIAAGIIYRF